ncbi:hypothetical protein DCAR_0206269 [Daucus carota subsp. sativus]|uniref:Uncharacterized protein n=1 Tax=Daucus carota subsp. sativus TaxID=79200 RepID=A0A161Y5W8_DAUCS|nr:PREDICTED: WRKY transcription factor 22-like [Daucus carota subsp. sativus]WOG87049.1 hypothetical protein DCAR_0206269 [Daucus carota subsp. sativus]
MGEFASMEEDWGLEAIVRSFTDDHLMNMSSSFDDFLYDFPHLYEATSHDTNEDTLLSFDQIYEPAVEETAFSSEASFPSSSSCSSKGKDLEVEFEETETKKNARSNAVKYKKKKNQHKRVVLQPEGQAADCWAWRKYGQKPIKGSPYPRSYYKCSSSKGCLARKQVEQSCTDPGMFIITYNSAEHNHAKPTRRSSLAGTNRHKFTALKTSSSDQDSSVTPPKDTPTASPTTPLWSSKMFHQQPLKNEKDIDSVIDEKSGTSESSNENEYIVSDDIMLNDDFFVGLEDLDRLISESGFYSFPSQTNS